MSKSAKFNFDSKLINLLGETYKSTELALKELIDNAYDAEAENVWVTMPESIDSTSHEIIIKDDGTGMKEQEVIKEYLKIASSRTARKGDRTLNKNRKVKGRKGIGKFAGLMVAEEMELKTISSKKETSIEIIKSELQKKGYDLDKINIPVITNKTDKSNGTVICLKYLNQRYSIPSVERFKEILVADYSREEGFNIFVNDEKVGVTDLNGKQFEKTILLDNGKKATLLYTITDKQIKGAGISVRVGNKLVGKPVNFLESDDVIPVKLKKRIYGELICDELEDDVSADWGGIVENSNLFNQISQEVVTNLTASLNNVYKQDMHLAKQRYNQQIKRELEKLPEHKRQFAEEALLKIIVKFFDGKDKDEKVDTLISLVIDALNKDHYWSVVQHLDNLRESEVFKLSEALTEFGLAEITFITSQARSRLKFLDSLDVLINDTSTSEEQIHKIIEKNLWLLGSDYSLIFSNQTLKVAIKNYLDKKFTGKRANKRPDLFLGSGIDRDYLLIEFKKPDHTLNRDNQTQVIKYKDDLRTLIHDKPIRCVLIGGKISRTIFDEQRNIVSLTYTDIISNARIQLEWLVKEINN